jgi:hypothetical protein
VKLLKKMPAELVSFLLGETREAKPATEANPVTEVKPVKPVTEVKPVKQTSYR